MRTKKALLNSLADVLYEITAIICGLILPRLILSTFGSSYNGITSSITQFISCVALLKSGIGGVTRASLYKPLAEHDHAQISRIVAATNRFMRRIALLFAGILVVMAAVYPAFVAQDFSWLFSFSLFMIIGVSTVIQYYFGMTYQMLLSADQKGYVYCAAQIITTILNTVISAILIKLGASIQAVKLGSTLVFVLNPLILTLYVKKHYRIDRHAEPDNSALAQRWDAFALQLANFINNNTDLAILTIFTDVRIVSVYTVYHLVLNAVQKIILKLAIGVEAALGDIIARNEQKKLRESFSALEFLISSVSVVAFSCILMLMLPFVKVYTAGVNDVDYIVPAFMVTAAAASYFFCIRTPYQYIVQAAGHFRQTRNGSFVEAGLNIVLSVVLVNQIGLTGVAVGTLAAMLFRTIQYSLYSYRHILHWRRKRLVLRLAVPLVNMAAAVGAASLIPLGEVNTLWGWMLAALPVLACVLTVTAVFALIFWRRDLLNIRNMLANLFKKKKRRAGAAC